MTAPSIDWPGLLALTLASALSARAQSPAAASPRAVLEPVFARSGADELFRPGFSFQCNGPEATATITLPNGGTSSSLVVATLNWTDLQPTNDKTAQQLFDERLDSSMVRTDVSPRLPWVEPLEKAGLVPPVAYIYTPALPHQHTVIFLRGRARVNVDLALREDQVPWFVDEALALLGLLDRGQYSDALARFPAARPPSKSTDGWAFRSSFHSGTQSCRFGFNLTHHVPGDTVARDELEDAKRARNVRTLSEGNGLPQRRLLTTTLSSGQVCVFVRGHTGQHVLAHNHIGPDEAQATARLEDEFASLWRQMFP